MDEKSFPNIYLESVTPERSLVLTEKQILINLLAGLQIKYLSVQKFRELF